MIKRKLWFVVSVMFASVWLYFAAQRVYFLSKSVRADGEVVAVTARNAKCNQGGSGSGSTRCTMFTAKVSYPVGNGTRVFSVSSGSAGGHNQPRGRAKYRVGASVPVLYDPASPGDVHTARFTDIWEYPLLLMIPVVTTFVMSLRKRREDDPNR